MSKTTLSIDDTLAACRLYVSRGYLAVAVAVTLPVATDKSQPTSSQKALAEFLQVSEGTCSRARLASQVFRAAEGRDITLDDITSGSCPTWGELQDIVRLGKKVWTDIVAAHGNDWDEILASVAQVAALNARTAKATAKIMAKIAPSAPSAVAPSAPSAPSAVAPSAPSAPSAVAPSAPSAIAASGDPSQDGDAAIAAIGAVLRPFSKSDAQFILSVVADALATDRL